MVCVQLTQACRWVSCLSCLSLLFLFPYVWFICPVPVAGFARRVGECLCFGLVLSSLLPLYLAAANRCVRRGSRLLCFHSAVRLLGRPLVSPSLLCVLAPLVSRPTVILTCSDHVQLSPPVDLCVRELSPPLSILSRGLWHAGENLLPSCHAR